MISYSSNESFNGSSYFSRGRLMIVDEDREDQQFVLLRVQKSAQSNNT
jgi:hypothetical protein